MKITPILCGVLVLAGCASVSQLETDFSAQTLQLLQADFKPRGPATMERLIQRDEVQTLCSQDTAPDAARAQALEASQLALVKYPANNKFLGDYKRGEAIAQNGRGMQSSDTVDGVNGGNCYACHQMSKAEISFGNIGPSLYQYGKLRGYDEDVKRYTWAKLYNAQAYRACSVMPRFGHNGILTESQLQDVMALLLDPASPVNK